MSTTSNIPGIPSEHASQTLWANPSSASGTVILVQPFLWEARIKNGSRFSESLALGYLAGALRKCGFIVKVINAEQHQISEVAVVASILAIENVCFVGLSCKSERSLQSAAQIASLVKERRPDIHVTIGGVISTTADVELLNTHTMFDSACRGEGEYLVTQLAHHLSTGTDLRQILGLTFRDSTGQIVRNASRPRNSDLDAIPSPFRSEMEALRDANQPTLNHALLVASRGCFASCSFCSIHQIYGDHAVVRRSPQNIVAEMEGIKSRFGINYFWFVDDLFITPSRRGLEWLDEFCSLLTSRQLGIHFHAEMRADSVTTERIKMLVRAGLDQVFIGIESGCDSILLRWDKGTTVIENNNALKHISEAKIPMHKVVLGYIMFEPEMSFEELRVNYHWLQRSGYCTAQLLQNKMNLYVGTPIYRRMIDVHGWTPPPLGTRWKYDFIDKRVGHVERCVRRVHETLQTDNLRHYMDFQREVARIRASARARKELTHIADCAEALLQHLKYVERELYYFVFDTLFEQFDAGIEDFGAVDAFDEAAARCVGYLTIKSAAYTNHLRNSKSIEELETKTSWRIRGDDDDLFLFIDTSRIDRYRAIVSKSICSDQGEY